MSIRYDLPPTKQLLIWWGEKISRKRMMTGPYGMYSWNYLFCRFVTRADLFVWDESRISHIHWTGKVAIFKILENFTSIKGSSGKQKDFFKIFCMSLWTGTGIFHGFLLFVVFGLWNKFGSFIHAALYFRLETPFFICVYFSSLRARQMGTLWLVSHWFFNSELGSRR